jgi:hypothetical protein
MKSLFIKSSSIRTSHAGWWQVLVFEEVVSNLELADWYFTITCKPEFAYSAMGQRQRGARTGMH